MRESTLALLPRETRGIEGTPALSVVVPFYNEVECANQVLDELRWALESLRLTYEVIAVDDGSTDGTADALATIAVDTPRLRVLRWVPNRGQAAALYWGLRTARAPVVVTMDGDGQNDPADIGPLLSDLDELDMVVGIRTVRKDSWLRRRMSRLANATRGRLLRDHMVDSGCALKVFRREVVDSLIPIRTLYSFMPALAVAAGFRVGQRSVRHRPRQGGMSSYGPRQFLWRPLLDLVGMWWFTRRRFVLPAEALPSAPLRLPSANAKRSG